MYPVMLNVKGRICTIIGGGAAAMIKAAALVREGAEVRIVSPEIHTDFADINHIAKKYEKSDLIGSFIVIAATDDEDLNRQIISDAAELGILALNASDPESSDFIPMAHISNGDVTVAASTGGAYPMLAKKICDDVDIEAYNKICKILKKQRKIILGKNISREEKRALFKTLITDEMISLGKNDINAFEKAADRR
ncbi:MAG: bifunctional precorrin-2 dehydrogenase/sirohydrochlorin ferrochelatase [Oscillospiraceae bacterium]|nr:bifunctional precorrin-2 dehydrogenase/sirohydrochlorin ferrochelatase [Oscillospiraceae bacterium]